MAALALVLLGGCGGGGQKTTQTGAAKPRATPKTPAPAGKAIGIGDQGAGVFAAPLFRQLGIDKARLVVPWDTMQIGYQKQLVDQWLTAAKQAGVEPFVSFSASRVHPTQLPTVAQVKGAVQALPQPWPPGPVYPPSNGI